MQYESETKAQYESEAKTVSAREDLGTIHSDLIGEIDQLNKLTTIARDAADRLFGGRPENVRDSTSVDAVDANILRTIRQLRMARKALEDQLVRF